MKRRVKMRHTFTRVLAAELFMNHPDIISIAAERREEIEADRADLRVTISGASLVTDRAAQNKAREIRDLAVALSPFGVSESQTKLQSVRLESAGGTILKSSSATYVLKIADVSVEILGDVLGALAAQKNLTMNGVAWTYNNEETARERLLGECLDEAKSKAERVVTRLGVRLLGVHEFREYSHGEGEARGGEMMDFLAPKLTRARQMDAEDFGIALSHSKEIRCGVTVQFRVSELGAKVEV